MVERDGATYSLGSLDKPLQLVMGAVTVWGDKLRDLGAGILYNETVCPVNATVQFDFTLDPNIMSAWPISACTFRVLFADGQLMTFEIDTTAPRTTITTAETISNYTLVAACGRLILAYDAIALANDTTHLISIGDGVSLDTVATLDGIYEELRILNNDAICCRTVEQKWDLLAPETEYKHKVRVPSPPTLFHGGQYRYMKPL